MNEIINFNDVIDLAIEKEENAVAFYQKALDIVKYPGAKEMLQTFVDEEKRHVSLLQEVKMNKVMTGVGEKEIPPDMSLTKFLIDEQITEKSTPQDVMLAAMKNEDNAVSLYAQQVKAFEGTELEAVFQNLMKMEEEHKEYLETEYEKHFMPDN